MTIAPRPVWPRRRAPWLANRFGRGLLAPGALRLLLRRSWASYRVVERWRRRSRLVTGTVSPSLALSVTVAMRGRLGPDRPARDIGIEVERGATHDAHTRLETLTTRLLEHTRGSGRGERRSTDGERMLVAASPARVVVRTPRWDPPTRGGLEPGRARHDPATVRRPGSEAAVRSPDIERLTDSVVAAIDRRLWSQRERMGGR